MIEEQQTPRPSDEDVVLQQQYRRALSSFEGIILSQIDIKNKLGDRLNYSIRAGTIVLGFIAVSILVLLLTLSAQITRISGVVADMNTNFTSVSDQMHQVRQYMTTMEERVGLLEKMDRMTAIMDREMGTISAEMDIVQDRVKGIDDHVAVVRNNVANIAVNMDLMNREVQVMSQEMHRMSKPARSMNKMFPFP